MPIAVAVVLAATAFAAEGDAPAGTPTLTSRVQHVAIDQRLWIDDEGEVREDEGSLSLQVNARLDGRITSWGRLRITTATTDTGETLVPKHEQDEMQRIDGNTQRRGGQPQFSFQLSFEVPARPAARIASVAGTLDIALAAGKPLAAEIAPVKDYLGKRVAIDGVPDAQVTLLRFEGRRVEIELSRATDQQLAVVTFRDAAGNELEANGWGTSSNGRTFKRQYSVQLPPDGAIVLQFHREVKTITVPFTLSDIPLPGARRKAQPAAATIPAREVADPAHEAEPAEVRPVPTADGQGDF